METWACQDLEQLGELPPLRLFDSAQQTVREVDAAHPTLYTCGITPYDATHLGHAFTYLMADTLLRYWLAAGKAPVYAQNVTDIDDPLFERAAATGVDWRQLADSQIALFRSDMAALGVVPPSRWIAVSEILDPLEETVRALEARHITYRLPNGDGSEDIYLDLTADPNFAQAPVFAQSNLAALFDEHGGDSTRPGKHHPLDQQLWKGVRGDNFRPDGGAPGAWRPGWHIECAYIARRVLGRDIAVQAGGRDLLFPHHEMSESLLRTAFGAPATVTFHMHAGMVAYRGEKMSKSLGNLVRVSELMKAGHDAQAVRLMILAHHYRDDWEYTDEDMRRAEQRLAAWRHAAGHDASTGDGGSISARSVAAAIAADLDTPRALAVVDRWAAAPSGYPMPVVLTVRALLGIDLLR